MSTSDLVDGRIDGRLQSVGVVASSCGKECLTTSATTNVGSEFTHQIASVQVVTLDDIVTDCNGKGDFPTRSAAKHPKERGVLCFELKSQVLDVLGVQVQNRPAYVDAMDGLESRNQISFHIACGFALEGLNVLGHFGIAFQQIFNG